MHNIVVSTGQPVVEMFNVLENHIHSKHNLFLNVKLFGMRLSASRVQSRHRGAH